MDPPNRRIWPPPEDIDFQVPQGGHGGADQQMVDDLFGQTPTSPVIATLEDGIQAVLVGAAANRSIAEGRRIDVVALSGGVDRLPHASRIPGPNFAPRRIG